MRRVENGLIQDWVTLRRNENSWKEKEGRNRWTESAVSVYQLGAVFSNVHFVFLDASFIAHTHTHTHTHTKLMLFTHILKSTAWGFLLLFINFQTRSS